jgi:hypothetical protein
MPYMFPNKNTLNVRLFNYKVRSIEYLLSNILFSTLGVPFKTLPSSAPNTVLQNCWVGLTHLKATTFSMLLLRNFFLCCITKSWVHLNQICIGAKAFFLSI